jgi:shikimate dehydrogenase
MHENKKEFYGLIGFPVKHSFSPAMHNAAFKARGIGAEYKLFEIAPRELEKILEDFFGDLNKKVIDTKGRAISIGDIRGFNITIPHKVRAKEILEKRFPSDETKALRQPGRYYVKLSGAINTLKRTNYRLDYWNTDANGFLRSLKEDLGFRASAKTALIIGCGGAGRAVIACLSWKTEKIKKIYISDVNQTAISSLKRHFLALPWEWKKNFSQKVEFIYQRQIAGKIKDCQLLVNASPVGMRKDDPSVIDKDFLHKDLFVYDVVYNRDTQLIKDAKEKGLPAAGGLGMLLYQGAASWELWTGQEAPLNIMKEALRKELAKLC